MNYFERFGIPVSFQVQATTLKAKFYALSRELHPDFAQGLSASDTQLQVEASAFLNQAYKTFQDPDATLGYALQVLGVLDANEKYALNSAFLMEVMDVNEQLMEWEMGEDAGVLHAIQAQVAQLQGQIESTVSDLIHTENAALLSPADLARVKEYYYQKKYLQRILDRIARGRNIATPNADNGNVNS
jgi:molecular chaperone HscB